MMSVGQVGKSGKMPPKVRNPALIQRPNRIHVKGAPCLSGWWFEPR